jgi:hypothetical protein
MENIGEQIDTAAIEKFREDNIKLVETLGPVIDQAEIIYQNLVAKSLLDDDPEIKNRIETVDKMYKLLSQGVLPHFIKVAQLSSKL